MANQTELQVINSVCKEKDISVLLTGNSDELFTAYGDVWSDIKSYYMKHRTVPDLKVLQDTHEGEIDSVEVSGPTEYYLDRLKSEYLKVRLKTITKKAADSIGVEAPAKVLEKMTTSLAKLTKFTTDVRDLDINDADAAIDHWTAIQDQQALLGRDIGLRTRFDSIDTAIPNGLAPGNLIYVLGFPGHGKSFLTQLMAAKGYDQGISPMIVNLEMSDKDVRDRAYTTIAPGLFDLSELQKADVDFDNFRAFAKKKLTGPKFMIIGAGGMTSSLTPSQIQGKIDQYKPGIVFIDYVQLMSDDAQTKETTPKMFNLSKELKRLAVSNSVPVVAVTSVSRGQNVSRDEMPGIENIAWSSSLEFDADHIWGVHRVPESNTIQISGLKNRFGPLWDFYCDVDLARGVWTERHDL